MAGFGRSDVRSNESSLKYFILGSFASAFLLYGLALTYGATATESFTATTTIASIAHAGYALVGFVAAGAATDPEQRSAALTAVAFYLLTYAVMNMGAFAVVTLIARRDDRETKVEDYNGIGFFSPALAFSLSLFLLSLLGMPLTAGFMGKIMVFSAALRQGYVWLVVIAVLNTAVSAYYYLRLIIVMFFRERTEAWEPPRIPASVALALVLTIVGVFYLGLFPGRVINAFNSRPAISLSVR